MSALALPLAGVRVVEFVHVVMGADVRAVLADLEAAEAARSPENR